MFDPTHPICVTSGTTATLDDDGDGSRSLVIGTAGDREVGIWEIEAGVATYVEVDEVFIVLSGSATISIDGFPDVLVQPGDVVHLDEGTPTTWTIHERLRKFYLISGAD